MQEASLFTVSNTQSGIKIEVNADALPDAFRKSDPETSKMAGKRRSRLGGGQRALLLRQFANGEELTDEQAGIKSGLADKPNCCYWKRLSELRALGLIEPTGRTAGSRAGEQQRICRLTEAGIDAMRELGAAGTED
jgi:hypothetical protein